MNPITYVTLPRAEGLRDESGWKRSPLSPEIRWILRCHFLIRTKQDEPAEIHLGNIVDCFNSTNGVLEKITHHVEYEQQLGLVQESLEQQLWENLSSESLSTELGLHLGAVPIKSLSVANRVMAVHNLKEALTRNDKIQMTHTQSRKISTTREYTLQSPDSARDTQYLVAEAYTPWVADVHLVYIDYLSVSWRKSLLGGRYTTRKFPEVIDGKHPNIIKIGAPLFRARYWKSLDSLVTTPVGKYRNGVGNPLDLEIVPIPAASSRYALISPTPTLYQLASEAFPARPK